LAPAAAGTFALAAGKPADMDTRVGGLRGSSLEPSSGSFARHLRDTLVENTRYFREKMVAAGFDVKPGVHPISPVMLYDAPLAQKFAERLLEEGIYAIGFFFPVVPKGQARIRTQISAAHSREHLDRAIDAFTRIGVELGVIKG
jgi:glycine C-acetyltransferase